MKLSIHRLLNMLAMRLFACRDIRRSLFAIDMGCAQIRGLFINFSLLFTFLLGDFSIKCSFFS